MIVEAWTNAPNLEPVVEIHLRAFYDDWAYYDTIDLEHITTPPLNTILRVVDACCFSDGHSELTLAVVFDGQETDTIIPFTQDKGCKKLVRKVPELSMEAGFELTAPWSRRMFESDEASEGMAAFREKRDASWIGGSDD